MSHNHSAPHNHSASQTILVLGGTAQGRRMADALAETYPHFRIVHALAGRMAGQPAQAQERVEIRQGGFSEYDFSGQKTSGYQGLRQWLMAHQVVAVVDATHPFAATISHNAVKACGRDIPLVIFQRPRWRPGWGDQWIDCASVDEAAALLPFVGRRPFITLGQANLEKFMHNSAVRPPIRLTARLFQPPVSRRIHWRIYWPHQYIIDRGPFSVATEVALLRRLKCDVVICKNSGGAETQAKLVAARRLQIPVLMIARPITGPSPFPSPPAFSDMAGVMMHLQKVLP